MKEQGFLQKSFIRTCGGQTPGSRPKGHSPLLSQISRQGRSTVSRWGGRGGTATLPRSWSMTEEMEQQGPALQRSPALGPAEHPAWEERGGS